MSSRMWSAAGLLGEADWVGTVPLPELPHAAAAARRRGFRVPFRFAA